MRVWVKPRQQMTSTIIEISPVRDEICLQLNNVNGDVHETFHMADIVLMQSTKLVDKHGTIIHDGDIIKKDNHFRNPYYQVVQAKSGEWRLDNSRGGWALSYVNEEVEVVGNIYEHLDLLELVHDEVLR